MVWLDAGGQVRYMTDSSYNTDKKAMLGRTDHFTVFGIAEKPAPAFADIEGHWAEEDILFAAARGLLNGTGDKVFSPDGSMTRAMFVTALYRLAGSPQAAGEGSAFTDIPAGAYYAGAVGWAAARGIVSSTSAATFAPDQPVTRQEMAVMMRNYAKAMGYALPVAREAVSTIEKVKHGDTVNLDLPSGGKLPGKVLEATAGKDVILEIDPGKGVTWIINGKDIPTGKLSDLNLKVDAKANTIPVTVIHQLTKEQKVMQLALSHNGPFDFPLTLRLEAGKENAGLFANLYYYNETDKALEYQSTAKIGADGNTDLPFEHASSYAVVIDETSHAPFIWEDPFADVAESDWFYDAVMYVCRRGLMNGTGAAAFSPNGAVTRAPTAPPPPWPGSSLRPSSAAAPGTRAGTRPSGTT